MKVIGTLVVWFRSTVQRAFRREFVENDWWFSPVCAGLYEESVTRQVAVQKDIWSRQTYYGICCSICNNSYAKLWGTGWAMLDLHYAHGLHQNLCTSFKAALTLMAPWFQIILIPHCCLCSTKHSCSFNRHFIVFQLSIKNIWKWLKRNK